MKRFLRFCDEVRFDAVVVTGASGLLMGPLLAHEAKKRLILVRKHNESTHSSRLLEGDVIPGQSLAFVDDFIRSGTTASRVGGYDCIGGTRQTWAGAFFWHDGSRFAREYWPDWLAALPAVRCWPDETHSVLYRRPFKFCHELAPAAPVAGGKACSAASSSAS